MADESRTEHPTPRRRQKAREKGQVARSREVSGALAVTTAVLVIASQAPTWAQSWRTMFRNLLGAAGSGEVTTQSPVVLWTMSLVGQWLGLVLVLMWLASLMGNIIQGGMVVATDRLTPKWERMNPAANLGKLFSIGGLSNLLKTLVPTALIAYVAVSVIARDWNQMLYAVAVGGRQPVIWMLTRAFEIAWKSCLVFLAWSLADHFLQKYHFEQQLRMSHQEIREELKQTEGNPTSKGRIRRLQRQLRRRLVLKRVELATVVVTNPTHYAVALEYRPEDMDAPVVVAKGRGLLAERIKEKARRHGVAIVENPPLAQALYRAVEVGRAIPPKLYQAVAELLAFIFRAQARTVDVRNASSRSSMAARLPISRERDSAV